MNYISTAKSLMGGLCDHWAQALVATFLACAIVAIVGGDGSPVYHEYPSLGQGLLKPWLNWSTADRWKLHELEPVGYEKVCYLAVEEPEKRANDEAVQQKRNPVVYHLLGLAVPSYASEISSRPTYRRSSLSKPSKGTQ